WRGPEGWIPDRTRMDSHRDLRAIRWSDEPPSYRMRSSPGHPGTRLTPSTSGVSPWFGWAALAATNLGRQPRLSLGIRVGLTAEVGGRCAARLNHGLTPEVTDLSCGQRAFDFFDCVERFNRRPRPSPRASAARRRSGRAGAWGSSRP